MFVDFFFQLNVIGCWGKREENRGSGWFEGIEEITKEGEEEEEDFEAEE